MAPHLARRVACSLALVTWAPACSDTEPDGSDASPPGGATWDCISTMNLAALNTAISVGDARDQLERLEADTSLLGAQRDYLGDLLGALDGLDDEDPVGDALDDVPCPL